MIQSFWRYSHLALAVSSFLLLTIASFTGIILAFEPVSERLKGYEINNSAAIKLAEVVPLLKEKYSDIQQIERDDYNRVIVVYTDEQGNNQKIFVHPGTGKILGKVQPQPAIFEWATTLHRSLFLHETGRVIVGITSFLLILIAATGIVLVVQRQKGWKRFFAKVEPRRTVQYYHIIFGRVSLFFILAIALTGTYLFLDRFAIKAENKSVKVNIDNIKEEPALPPTAFHIFKTTSLSQLKSLQYPFSDFPEDYYTLKLIDRELAINQFTGHVLAQEKYTSAADLAAWNMRWHTGRSNAVWAVVLAIASGYILFFIYSGFVITWKRLRSRSANKFTAAESEIILLVGSENGSTYDFAKPLYKQLLKQGYKVYISSMDEYMVYNNATHLIILTGTYGEGEAPANARKFIEKLDAIEQTRKIQYSVIGFGSRSYKHFCGYAFDIHEHILNKKNMAPLLEVYTVDDRSPADFYTWLTAWSKAANITVKQPLRLSGRGFHGKGIRMKMVYKSALNTSDTFVMRMQPIGFAKKITSGDLLAIYPANDYRERLYSVGKIGKHIQLSVKWHEGGLGSNYLYNLNDGELLKTRVVKNVHFHFPRKAQAVIMIANGTGIAPFMGMIDANYKKLETYLYAGFRTREAFAYYDDFLSVAKKEYKLTQCHLSLSREENKEYVFHSLQKNTHEIAALLQRGAVIMICGSLAMYKDVMHVLREICNNNHLNFEELQQQGKILSDCY